MSAPSGPVLEALAGPTPWGEFLAKHWRVSAAYWPATDARRRLLGISLDAVWDILRSPTCHKRLEVKAQYYDAAGAHEELSLPPTSWDMAPKLVDAGMTICVSDFDRACAPVADVAREVGGVLGIPGPVDVSCYISRPGAGFGLHYDNVPVLVLQCRGKKRWFYGEAPSVREPVGGLIASNHRAVAELVRALPGGRFDIPTDAELRESLLSTGDALFLPPGTWHRARAEEVSLGLTFTLSPRRLDAALAAATASRLARKARHAFQRVAPGGAPPPSAAQWVRSRLALFGDASGLDATELVESGEIEDLKRGGADWGSGTTEARKLSFPLASGKFRVTGRSEVAMFTGPDAAGERRLFVYHGEKGLTLRTQYREPLEALLARDTFSLAEVRGPEPGDDTSRMTRELILPLLDLGVLASGV
jgi:hypothetical protein